MTLVNRLIWQARHGATDVVIHERDVGKIAHHVMTTMDIEPRLRAEVEQYIHEGKVTMCGATVRVLQ